MISKCRLICLCLVLISACKPEPKKSAAQTENEPVADYPIVARAIASSCMPCHNKQTLETVIQRVQAAQFEAIEGESRLRILAELETLKAYMEDGIPLSFSSKAEVDKYLQSSRYPFYLMLEKGVMPPRWAAELMQQIDWPNYQVLPLSDRIEMLKYAKPSAQKYLR